ncbi:MAG: ABC transporter ATP-binding protein [Nitrospirota bacterium]
MLTVENLSVHFTKGLFRKKIKALDGLNLEVKDGDFFALIGQNGAGKSTAMYCFLGLIHPTAGNVKVFGETPELGTGIYDEIAYLPEEPHYDLYLTVEEAVTYYSSLYRKRVSAKEVADVLDRLGLSEFKDLKLSKCSKGMKQKTGIAQCILNKPRLIFLDEPTRGLDPIAVMEVRDILVELNRAGATIIMNSHVLSEIETLANKVAIIEKGRLVVQSALTDLLKLDSEVYVVEAALDGGSLPEYLTGVAKTERGMTGMVPRERFYDFMDYTKAAGVKIYECRQKKMTLEESFLSVLKGRSDNA